MPPLLRRLFSTSARSLRAFSRAISWKPTGRPQRTLARPVARSGTALHSGGSTTARLLPAAAGEGRYFVATASGTAIPATVAHAIHSPLCTTLRAGGGGARVRTVEHLLSALEACGVDNCRIEIDGGDEMDQLYNGWMLWNKLVCVLRWTITALVMKNLPLNCMNQYIYGKEMLL